MMQGTYSWYITHNHDAMMQRSNLWWASTIDGRTPSKPSGDGKQNNNNDKKSNTNNNNNNNNTDEAKNDGPLLRYEVTTVYSKQPVLVYEYERPNPLRVCTSVLASVLPAYKRLCQKREFVIRADEFNSQPSIVLEQQDKVKIGEFAKAGTGVLAVGNEVLDQ